jgi:hypothetical protein
MVCDFFRNLLEERMQGNGPGRMRKSLKAVIAPLVLLGASTALALGVAETSLRAFPELMPEEAGLRLHWREIGQEPVSQPDPYLGFVYPPNYHGRFERDDGDFAFTYSTDEHGFRNPPRPERAEIVVLGDSMAFGYGVDDEEAWTTLLADRRWGRGQDTKRSIRDRIKRSYLVTFLRYARHSLGSRFGTDDRLPGWRAASARASDLRCQRRAGAAGSPQFPPGAQCGGTDASFGGTGREPIPGAAHAHEGGGVSAPGRRRAALSDGAVGRSVREGRATVP